MSDRLGGFGIIAGVLAFFFGILIFAFYQDHCSSVAEQVVAARSIYCITQYNEGHAVRRYYANSVERKDGFVIFVDNATGGENSLSGNIQVAKLKETSR